MLKRFAQVLVKFNSNADDIVDRVMRIDNNGVVQEFHDPGSMSGEFQIEVEQNTVCQVSTTITDSEGYTVTSPVAIFRAGNLVAPEPDTIGFQIVSVIDREVPDPEPTPEPTPEPPVPEPTPEPEPLPPVEELPPVA